MRLHVNIDHVATLREARRTDEPDPVRAAVLAELGGADGITVHLREDRRHIQDRDVRLLAETVRTGINFELASDAAIVELALELAPRAVTLVPERREEITTEGGLALGDVATRRRIGAVVDRLSAAGLRVSLFIDPDRERVEEAVGLGAHAVELHTGEYASAWARTGSATEVREEVARLGRGAAHARTIGLAVHAGHGLTYENVARIAAIEEIEELNIGHSIVSRALFSGMESAVREMKRAMRGARCGAVEVV
ncbi:MAG: pyridoxine 5'-phosphate synthase [Longimicrobiales bacterium]